MIVYKNEIKSIKKIKYCCDNCEYYDKHYFGHSINHCENGKVIKHINKIAVNINNPEVSFVFSPDEDFRCKFHKKNGKENIIKQKDKDNNNKKINEKVFCSHNPREIEKVPLKLNEEEIYIKSNNVLFVNEFEKLSDIQDMIIDYKEKYKNEIDFLGFDNDGFEKLKILLNKLNIKFKKDVSISEENYLFGIRTCKVILIGKGKINEKEIESEKKKYDVGKEVNNETLWGAY